MFSTKSIRGLFVVIIILFLTSVGLAQTLPGYVDVTVIKRDGWTYKQVAVQVSSEGDAMQIERSDGAILLLPLNSIFKILDSQGIDITGDLIPAYKASLNLGQGNSQSQDSIQPYNEFSVAEEPEIVPGSWVYQEPKPPLLFEFMLVAGIGYSAPMGDFYSGLKAGELYLAEICLSLAPQTYLRFGYRSMQGADRGYSYYDYPSDSIVNYQTTVDVRQYNLTVGTMSRPNRQNNARYYLEFGLGIADHIFKTSENSEINYQSNKTNLLIVLKGGMLFPLVGDFGVDVGASMGSKMFLGGRNEGFGFLMDIQAGLTYKFGGE